MLPGLYGNSLETRVAGLREEETRESSGRPITQGLVRHDKYLGSIFSVMSIFGEVGAQIYMLTGLF